MTEIKLYKSKKKIIKIILLCAPFIALGLWILANDTIGNTEKIMGWLITSFFGLSIPFGLFHILDRRPQVILNEFGIFDRTTHNEFINWQIIEEAYPSIINGQHFISLVVADAFKPSKKKGFFYKKVAKLNEILGFQELNIQLSQLDIDTIKLTNFIITMAHATPAKRQALLVKATSSTAFSV